MTHKRVVAVVLSIWLLSAFGSLIILWGSLSSQSRFFLTIVVIGLLLTAVVYMRIYLVARRHKNQMQSLQVQVEQIGEMAQFASVIKSAVGIFYVYLVFLVCYLPYIIGVAAIEINGPGIALIKKILSFLSDSHIS